MSYETVFDRDSEAAAVLASTFLRGRGGVIYIINSQVSLCVCPDVRPVRQTLSDPNKTLYMNLLLLCKMFYKTELAIVQLEQLTGDRLCQNQSVSEASLAPMSVANIGANLYHNGRSVCVSVCPDFPPLNFGCPCQILTKFYM